MNIVGIACLESYRGFQVWMHLYVPEFPCQVPSYSSCRHFCEGTQAQGP
jgi:hypothetical protein